VIVLLGLDVGGDEQRLLGAVLVLLAAAGYAASALLISDRPSQLYLTGSSDRHVYHCDHCAVATRRNKTSQ